MDINSGTGGVGAGIASQDKQTTSSGAATVNGTFTSTVDWSAVAVEIKGA